MGVINENCSIKREYHIAKRIVSQSKCENAINLMNEYSRQPVIGKDAVCIIKYGGYVLLDFGEELQGGAIVTVQRTNGKSHMRIVFGESACEAMSDIGEKNSVNNHSVRDSIVEITSWQQFRIGQTGFRFIKLESVDCDVCLLGVQAVCEYRDYESIGDFLCSDNRLNQIWNVGKRTVQLNMQEYLIEGIKRDRLIWVGDMHPQISTIAATFGKVPIVTESLDFVRDNTPYGNWMNGFPSYSFWWLIIQRDWYNLYGDMAYLSSQSTCLYDMLKNISEHINSDGSYNFNNTFVEWTSKDTSDEKYGFSAMLVLGIKAGIEVCEVLENYTLAAELKSKLTLIESTDYRIPCNKQISAMLALAGLADLREICDNIITPGGADGISAFWGYYTLKALSENDDMSIALDIIRDYWGGMIDMGATSFWEEFDMARLEDSHSITQLWESNKKDVHGDFGRYCYEGFRRSLCHGWASGPTAFLSMEVLGVKILEPGFKKIRIVPNLGNLNWAKGKIPTPYGIIEIEHKSIDGVIETKLKLPERIMCIE